MNAEVWSEYSGIRLLDSYGSYNNGAVLFFYIDYDSLMQIRGLAEAGDIEKSYMRFELMQSNNN